MNTVKIDGLPGITIQGKKGSDGRPGNKTILYSKEINSEFDSNKLYICYLVKTPWTLNDYNAILSDDSHKKKEDFASKYSSFINIINSLSPISTDETILLKFSYDSEDNINIYEYDYFLYPGLNSTELYILTSNIFAKTNSNTSEADDSSDESTVIPMLLWKIDDWNYVSGGSNLEKNDVKIEISEISKEYDGWDGAYYLDKNIPCIPAGSTNKFGDTIETEAGHLFAASVFNTDARNSYIESMCKIIDDYAETFDVLDLVTTIKGTVYDIETNEPIPYFQNAIGLYTYSDRQAGKEVNFNSITKYISTDDKGEFTININNEKGDNSEFPYALISSSYRDDYTSNIKFFVTSKDELFSENDFANVKFYLYRTESYANIYKFDDFSKVNIFQAYNTSKVGINNTDEYNYTQEEIKEQNKKKEKYIKFTYKSNLSDVENNKIKVEAEFIISDSQYAVPSTCYAKQWITTEETASDPSNVLGGRIENFGNDFNFDSENLRNFTIIIKDYEQDAASIPSATIPGFIYNNYNIYIYMYYKDSGGAAKKMLLNEDYIDIKLSAN